MKTKRLDGMQTAAIEVAATLLRDGYLVVFPTDTVYGVGADVGNGAAIEQLYVVKERPPEKGIPVLLSDVASLRLVARDVPEMADSLMARFWPGPLTLILPKRRDLPGNLTPNEKIAVRIPANDIARAVIRAAGGAVATTSANRTGERAARTAEEAWQALQGSVAAVVDGGSTAHGTPSTIVDCTVVPAHIVRQGPLTAETLFQNGS